MDADTLAWLRNLITTGRTRDFYRTWKWKRLRQEILADDRGECQVCKARGYYEPANTVHHVRYLEDQPELAMSRTYIDDYGKEQRQLISLCHKCHDEIHEHGRQTSDPLTPERW